MALRWSLLRFNTVCLWLLQPEEAAAGPPGRTAEGGGAHLLHQLPGRGGGQAAEDRQGESTAPAGFLPLLSEISTPSYE